MKKTSAFILSVGLLFAGLANAQTVGDYRSVVNGNWGVVGTWETYNGSAWVAASAVPPVVPPYANITIQAGDTVIVEASPKRAASLKVEGTAFLYANNTTNRYIRLWGNVTNDGTVGGTSDGLCYMCSTSVVFNGMGSTNISRLQVAAAGVSVTIDRPITLHYTGAALYGNNVDNVTYTVGANGQVDFGPTSFVSITTNTSYPSPFNATYNLAGGGFVLQSGMNFNMSVRSGKKSVLNLSGGLTLGDTLIAYSDSAGTEVVNINEGGVILWPSTDTLRFDSLNISSSGGFWPPTPAIIKGGLGLYNGMYQNYPTINCRIDKNATVDRRAGVFYAKPIFSDTFNLIYSGTAPCTTGYEMPRIEDNILPNLTVDHELLADTSRMVNNLKANGGPIVSPNGYFGVLGSFNKNSTDGYVIGYMGRHVPVWAAGQDVHFAVGTSQGYTPAVAHFNNVSKSGMMACMANDGEHASAAVPQQTLKRWWNLGWRPDSIATFDDYGLDLAYLSSDFNADLLEADDELDMVAGKYDAGWTFPAIASRDTANNTIQLSGLIDFSDFTMAKNQNSLAPDTIAPVITATYPANGATEVALNTLMYIAFSEPVDTLSANGSINPVPATSYPSWNPTMDTMFYVHSDLELNTTYTLTLIALNDLAGNPLAVLPDSFMFTTTVGDTVRPYIVSTYPAWGAIDVGLNDTIVIAFSEPMDTISLAGSMTPSPNEEPAWNATMDTLFLIHDPMTANTSYIIRLTALTDMAGNPLAVLPDSITFTTTVGDTIKPYITWTFPADGDSNVTLGTSVIVVFSEPMDTLSIVGSFLPDPGNVYSTWNAAMDTMYLQHDALLYNTLYTVTLTSGTDLAGNPVAVLPDSFRFTSIPSGIAGKPGERTYVLQLNPAAPNPVTSGTAIRFSLPASAQASLEVFNVLGQKVATLANGKLDAGYHTINWNGTDRNGAKLVSGVYIYQLRTMNKTLTKRMTILR